MARMWLLLCALLAAGAALAALVPAAGLDWQPERALREPWRAWSAAFVHWTPRHLAANLLGAALVAALGVAARLPARAAAAWALAWPLSHALLAGTPALAHYGGLSGVLHAGVAVGAAWLLVCERGARRGIGAALAAGLVVKVALEGPFGAPLHTVPGWDFPIAPLAHATGVLTGSLCGMAAALLRPGPESSA